MAKKQSHTGFRNEALFCFHCGGSQKLPLPMHAALAAEWMLGFDKVHKNCAKIWVEPVNEVIDKTEEQNINWWLLNGEQGVSSKTMMKYLGFGGQWDINSERHPSDPDDFRRCYLLLKAVPQFKSKLHVMSSVSETWKNLVDHWDKLTEMLEEQMQTKKANGMYEFMKSLKC
jgi:hypothetical protein